MAKVQTADLKNELAQLSKYVTVSPQFPTQSMSASPATSATPPPMTNHYISLGVAPISPAISGHPLDSFSNADLVSIDDFLNSVSATFDVPAKTFGLGGNVAIKNETGVFDSLFAFPMQQQAGYQQQSQQSLFQQPMFQQQPQQSFFNQPQSQQYPPQMYQQQPQFQQPFIPSQPAPPQQLQYQQSQQFNQYQTYTNTNNPYGNQSPQLPRMLQTSVPQMAPAAPRPDIPQLPSFKEICPPQPSGMQALIDAAGISNDDDEMDVDGNASTASSPLDVTLPVPGHGIILPPPVGMFTPSTGAEEGDGDEKRRRDVVEALKEM
ncbi:hypothetical protein HDU99_009598, partial [Rhizoclosmatium hyalinum]